MGLWHVGIAWTRLSSEVIGRSGRDRRILPKLTLDGRIWIGGGGLFGFGCMTIGLATQSRVRRGGGRRSMDPTRAVEAINPVVIAPTYKNAGTVADVLTRVGILGLPILVVNDGSTDATRL